MVSRFIGKLMSANTEEAIHTQTDQEQIDTVDYLPATGSNSDTPSGSLLPL